MCSSLPDKITKAKCGLLGGIHPGRRVRGLLSSKFRRDERLVGLGLLTDADHYTIEDDPDPIGSDGSASSAQ